MGATAAPSVCAANSPIIISGELWATKATTSPRFTPNEASPAATARRRASSADQVRSCQRPEGPRYRTAGRGGSARARAAISSGTVWTGTAGRGGPLISSPSIGAESTPPCWRSKERPRGDVCPESSQASMSTRSQQQAVRAGSADLAVGAEDAARVVDSQRGPQHGGRTVGELVEVQHCASDVHEGMDLEDGGGWCRHIIDVADHRARSVAARDRAPRQAGRRAEIDHRDAVGGEGVDLLVARHQRREASDEAFAVDGLPTAVFAAEGAEIGHRAAGRAPHERVGGEDGSQQLRLARDQARWAEGERESLVTAEAADVADGARIDERVMTARGDRGLAGDEPSVVHQC